MDIKKLGGGLALLISGGVVAASAFLSEVDSLSELGGLENVALWKILENAPLWKLGVGAVSAIAGGCGFILSVAGYVQPRPLTAETARREFAAVKRGLDENQAATRSEAARTRLAVSGEGRVTRREIAAVAYGGPRFRQVRWSEKFERPHPYAPTKKELADGLVALPAEADAVVTALQQNNWALVLGRGASGKTTLGYLLMLDSRVGAQRSFYLDLSSDLNEATSISGVAAAMFSGADRNDLFVIDNVHSNEDVATEAWEIWNELQVKPRLLLMGRELRHSAGSRFSNQAAKPIILLARERTIAGVYLRLATRRFSELGRPDTPAHPPAEALTQWISEFGGRPDNPRATVDLMALSAAIRRKIDHLIAGQWLLNVADARDEIRTQYLNVSDAERHNLVRLAAMPEDFNLPAEALPDKYVCFPLSVQRGIVFEKEVGQRKRRAFSFAHGALARLLLDASGEQERQQQEREAVAKLDSFAGIHIGILLLRLGAAEAGRSAILAVIQSDDWLKRYHGSIHNLRQGLLSVKLCGLLTDRDIRVLFESEADEIRRLVGLGSLEGNIAFNIHVGADPCWAVPARIISEHIADRWEAYLNRAKASFPALLDFFQVIRSPDLENVRNRVIVALEREPDTILAQVKTGSLDQLATFVVYANAIGLRSLRDRVFAYLRADDTLERLVSSASSFSALTSFLRVLDAPDLMDLRDRAIAAIGSRPDDIFRKPQSAPAGGSDFLGEARTTSLEQIATFVAYVEAAGFKDLRDRIFAHLRTEGTLETLVSSASSYHALTSLLRVLEAPDLKGLRKRAIAAIGNRLDAIFRKPQSTLGSGSDDAIFGQEQTASLEQLAIFVAYVEAKGLKGLRDRIFSHLRASRRLENLVASTSSLQELTRFMRLLEFPDLKDLRERAIAALGSEPGGVLQKAQNAPLDQLWVFLSYAAGASDALADQPGIFELARAVAQDISLEDWEAARDREEPIAPSTLRNWADLFEKLDRMELVHVLARKLIREGAWDWDDATVWHIGHLSHVIRCASGLPPAELKTFVDRNVTDAWLERQYSAATVVTLASALGALSLTLDAGSRARFQRAALEGRLRLAVEYAIRARDPEKWAQVFRFIGAYEMFAGRAANALKDLRCVIRGQFLIDILSVDGPKQGRQGITAKQVHLWKGLRVLGQLGWIPDLNKHAVDSILRVWRLAAPANSRAREINADMIDWLERCMKAKWKIVS